MPNLFGRTSASSPHTLQRIPTSQLRPGMFLVRILDSWWKSPFFVHRRLLKSSTEVQQLRSSGIREVEIDTSLGVGVLSEPEAEIDEATSREEPTDDQIVSTELNGLVRNPQASVSFVAEEFSEQAPDQDEFKRREEIVQLREVTMAAVEGAFEGVKTGQPISRPAVHQAAQALVSKTLANPGLVAEVLLIDSLKQFDKTLYAHVVDTAVYAILVGLQLGWNEGKLERVGVAGLLHDVGYMRLPQNVVKARWDGRGEAVLLEQHVAIGEALIQGQGNFSSDVVSMVREHHAYQDGSGYPKEYGGEKLTKSGQLLGIVDCFDELITVGGISGALPAALAIRRLYLDAQKGKFSLAFIEAMIRALGIFPVGTVVELSTGQQAVVVKQHSENGLKPQIKIFLDVDGQELEVPEVCDLSKDNDAGNEISIARLLDPTEYSLNPGELICP